MALGCGHVLEGVGHYEIGGEKPARVECPEGCGWQSFVVEPGSSTGCLCEPGRHVCGEIGMSTADRPLEEGEGLFDFLDRD